MINFATKRRSFCGWVIWERIILTSKRSLKATKSLLAKRIKRVHCIHVDESSFSEGVRRKFSNLRLSRKKMTFSQFWITEIGQQPHITPISYFVSHNRYCFLFSMFRMSCDEGSSFFVSLTMPSVKWICEKNNFLSTHRFAWAVCVSGTCFLLGYYQVTFSHRLISSGCPDLMSCTFLENHMGRYKCGEAKNNSYM